MCSYDFGDWGHRLPGTAIAIGGVLLYSLTKASLGAASPISGEDSQLGSASAAEILDFKVSMLFEHLFVSCKKVDGTLRYVETFI